MIPDADELAAIQEEHDLAAAAIISASDLEFAYKLQLSEAFKASLANCTFKSESARSSPLRGALPPPAPSSDATVALMLHANELVLGELELRDIEASFAALTHDIASASLTSHDALLARKLDGIPEARWGRHLNKSALPPPSPLTLVFKGMTSKQVIGSRDFDPQIAVLVAAISVGQQQEKQVIVHKLLDTFSGSKNMVELKALAESLEAVRPLQSHGVSVITDNKTLHQYMLGTRKPNGKKMADIVNQALSMEKTFEQCEIRLVDKSQVRYVGKLAKDTMNEEVAKFRALRKRETCIICFEDADITKIHAVEGCAHRFCYPCMTKHVKAKLLYGPDCPQADCATKLTVEAAKIFLSPSELDIMVQHIKERQIPPEERFYCPYRQCSAVMSLCELIQPMQDSSSKYTVEDAATLRKCVRCRGSFCIKCKVIWHDGMTCNDYEKKPHSEDAGLEKLAKKKLWRKCVKCGNMIELESGCYHMTCICGCEFCYRCGKEWKEKKAGCSCRLWDDRYIIRGE